MSSILSFEGVTLSYPRGNAPVLSGLSFEVAAGERVALLGLNGSGKTTLLSSIVGLSPHQGRIVIDGIELSRESMVELRKRIGFLFNVPEEQLLMPKVLDDVVLGLEQRGVSHTVAVERARQMLESLGIGGLTERDVTRLSHGQQQLVALAGAMITRPSILLLDEPSAGLDPPTKHRLVTLLTRLDAALLVATHDLGFARALCSRCLLLEAGGLINDVDSLEAVKARWSLTGED